MHLTKLFNGKYLWQNVKKSKLALMICLTLVPILTSLVLITSEENVFDFASLAGFNIAGMYIIPFLISVCLFGYVYKKSSVDFMGSMPISRKTIFITNTLGGIALIVVMQLMTFLLTSLISLLMKGTVFVSMAWDVFVYQTIAYIFVMVTANLAMSLSGTLTTQIAVTLLLIFTVPFSAWYINEMTYNYTEEYQLVNQDVAMGSFSKIENYTAPFYFMNGTFEWNGVSVCKMMFLSIIYMILGYVFFLRKKMEVAGESFENKYVHLIVKGLTLIPFVVIFKSLMDDTELTLSLVIFTIIVAYYLVFDLITSKKMKWLDNVIGLITSIVLLVGFYSLAIQLMDKVEKKVSITSVQEMYLDCDSYFYASVKDNNKIFSVLSRLIRDNNRYTSDKERYSVKVTLRTQIGTKYYRYMYVSQEVLNGLWEETLLDNTFGDNVALAETKVEISQQERQQIVNAVRASFSKLTTQDMVNANKNYINLRLVSYRQHELMNVYYPIILDEEVQKIVLQAFNRYTIHYLQSGGYCYADYTVNSFNKFDEDTKEKVWFAMSREDSKERVDDFILAHADDTPQRIDSCIMLYNYQYRFFTNHVDEFLKLVEEIYQDHIEEWEEYEEYEWNMYDDWKER